MLDALIVLVILLALGLALWEQRHYTGPRQPRDRAELPTVCAWCIYRDDDMCTNPRSPVKISSEWREVLRIVLNPVTAVFGDSSSVRDFKGECGPVCIGDLACNVREMRR
jgi:hypothetical protein